MADVVYVVDDGMDIITNRIKGAGTEPKYVGWGTGGATAATATDDALTTPSDEARTDGTSSRQLTNVANDTYRVVGLITALAGQTISEVGLFDAAGGGTPTTGGNLFLRGTFTGLVLGIGDSIQFTIDSEFDQA